MAHAAIRKILWMEPNLPSELPPECVKNECVMEYLHGKLLNLEQAADQILSDADFVSSVEVFKSMLNSLNQSKTIPADTSLGFSPFRQSHKAIHL